MIVSICGVLTHQLRDLEAEQLKITAKGLL